MFLHMYIVASCICIFKSHIWHGATGPILCLPFATQSYVHKIYPRCHVASPLLLITAKTLGYACTTHVLSSHGLVAFIDHPIQLGIPSSGKTPHCLRECLSSVLAPSSELASIRTEATEQLGLKYRTGATLPGLRIPSLPLLAKPYSL